METSGFNNNHTTLQFVFSHTADLILMMNKIKHTRDSDAERIRAVGLVGDVQCSFCF